MAFNIEGWILGAIRERILQENPELVEDEVPEWVLEELRDRIFKRCFGLVEYEDETGGMIPGMYVVYPWHGLSLDQMQIGRGQALFDNCEDAKAFCDLMDYREVLENMTSRETENHHRWTVGYIAFCSETEISDKVAH